MLPDSPRQARFLTDEEKEALTAALAETGTEHQEEQKESSIDGKGGETLNGQPLPEQAAAHQQRTLAHDWASLMEAVRCPIVWCGGVWRMLYAVAGTWRATRLEGALHTACGICVSLACCPWPDARV